MQKSLLLLLILCSTANCWFAAGNDEMEEKPEVEENVQGAEPIEIEGSDEKDDFQETLSDTEKESLPTVLISVLVRNKAHVLPYFFGCLERLSYPKNKISFFIRGDHNVDRSNEMVREWMSKTKTSYGAWNVLLDDDTKEFKAEKRIKDWVSERFQHVINLREEALAHARKTKQDFIFFVDADNLLLHNNVIRSLMKYEKTIVAPMLKTVLYQYATGKYSNWWPNVTDDGFDYKHSKESDDIYSRKKLGLFKVAAVHSTFLIDLRKPDSRLLSFRPNSNIYLGRLDDVVIFNFNARHHKVNIWLSNEQDYGSLPKPYHPPNNLEAESYRHFRLQMDHILNNSPVPVSSHITADNKPNKTKLGMDHIYVISLKHRENRQRTLQFVFNELGIKAEFFNAVDGRALTKEDVKKHKMEKCRDYRHYPTGRDLTYGEIGCFMSHYLVWKDALARGFKRVMIMEDDAAFEMGFMRKYAAYMKELENVPDWDFLYFGRHKVHKKVREEDVAMTDNWVHPSFNTFLLHYALTDVGLKKLVSAEPLTKLVPADLFVPIMYGQYDDNKVNRHFAQKDLIALATKTILTYPIKYWVEKGHTSDTDNGNIIPPDFIQDNDLFLKDEL